MRALRVPSQRQDDRTWTVEERGVMRVCDCPAFVMGKRRPCKHIELVRRARALLAKCYAEHKAATLAPDLLCEQCLVTLLGTAKRKVARELRAAAKEKRHGRVREGAPRS